MVSIICSRLSAVGLLSLLYILWPRDSEAFIINYPNVEVSRELELLQYVMLNDEIFDVVLHQQIRIDEYIRPPYQGEGVNEKIRESLRLFGHEVTQIEAYTVIRRIVNDFSWFGSFLEYGVNVFQTALVCTSLTFVSIQMELIMLMEEKNNPDNKNDDLPVKIKTNSMFNEAWITLTIILDKLGAVNGNLEMLADISYLYTELAMRNEIDQMHALKLMKFEVDKIIGFKCVRIDVDTVYRIFNIVESHSRLTEGISTHDDIICVFKKLTEGIIQMYEEFNMTSMEYSNLNQVLDFQIPIAKDLNLFTKIDEILMSDSLGKSLRKKKTDRQEIIVRSLDPINTIEEIPLEYDEEHPSGMTTQETE